MKSFRIISPKEQRERFPAMLRRSYAASKRRLLEKYKRNLKDAERLFEQANRLEERIAKLEDAVADKADRDHGGWGVWRNNEKLLKKSRRRNVGRVSTIAG